MKKSLPLVIVGLIAVAVLAFVAASKFQEKGKEYGLIPTAAPKVVIPGEESARSTSLQIGETPVGGKRVSAQVEYDSPGGMDQVKFELIVDESGKIIQAGLTPRASNRESDQWINSFEKAFPSVVVGKKLADMTDLDIVARASLTTDAFNQALPSLKKQLL